MGQLQDKIDQLYQTLNQLNQGFMKPSKYSKYEDLARVIVGALKESRLKPFDQRHLPQQALMAFFFKKFNTKEDILSLIRKMPDLLSDSKIIENGNTQREFLAERWQASNLEQYRGTPHALAQQFMKDPEAMIFVMKQHASKVLPVPPAVSYKMQVPHSSLKGGVETHGDCGESMARDLMNLAIYNPKLGKLDIDGLMKEHPELHPTNATVIFYQKNKDPAQISQDTVHEGWNETVASHLDGVEYRQGNQPRRTRV